MDTYGGGLGVLWVAIFETMAIMWIYGVQRFSSDLKFMLNHNMNFILKFLWIMIPIFLSAIFAIACYFWEAPTYKDKLHGEVHYPEWAHYVGWFLTLIVAVQVSIWNSIYIIPNWILVRTYFWKAKKLTSYLILLNIMAI